MTMAPANSASTRFTRSIESYADSVNLTRTTAKRPIAPSRITWISTLKTTDQKIVISSPSSASDIHYFVWDRRLACPETDDDSSVEVEPVANTAYRTGRRLGAGIRNSPMGL